RRWIRRRRCKTRRDFWRVSAANFKREIRCFERSWNCIGGEAIWSDCFIFSSARGQGVGVVWGIRGGGGVRFFFRREYGDIEATTRLFRSKQRGVRNPASCRSGNGATDRPG